MTRFPDLFNALLAPFESNEVRARTQSGRQLHYITARTAMNRLDAVVGPENWWDEYVAGDDSVLCKLTIRLPDGSTLTKADAGGYAGMADSGDDDKSGYSDSFKRAAVKFGVGRYLYRDGVPDYARDRDRDASPAQPPATEPEAPAEPAPVAASRPQAPRSGRALFAWTKEQEQRHEVGLLKYLNGWAKLQDYPGRMVDWDAEQVGLAYTEACRKLHAHAAGHREAREEVMAN